MIAHWLHIHRILFIVTAATAAFWVPIAFAAEPAQRLVRVGFVDPASPSTHPRGVEVFWRHLRELGWIEGRNMIVEARWADGNNDRLPALVAELVERKVDVLVTYGTPSAMAAVRATRTIPIVDAAMADPVASGLVTSLAHPGGNFTGLSLAWAGGMTGKRLELLQETVPHLSTVATITGADDSQVIRELAKEVEGIAPTRGIKVRVIEVRDTESLDRAFKQARKEAQAVLFPGGLFMHRREITALAAKYKLPAMFPLREYVDMGGLMAYGADSAFLFRRAADYVDKILRGAKPGDLPIEQPTKYELVVNLKTAKALGIVMPESILLRADEVIR
jgi:putative ABC transport system substrate-binding protein